MTDATIQPMPPADDVFARARADAVAHHVKALRDAILARRARGEHALVEQVITDELGSDVFHSASPRDDALRSAIGALRGFGEHTLLKDLLADELGDTITERRSIDARRAQRLRARLRLLSPAPARTATEIN